VASVIRIIIGADAALRGLEARRVMLAVWEPGKLQLPFFDWLTIPPPPWLNLYAVLWITLALAFCVGWRTRLVGIALAATMFASLFFDQQLYSNHLYLISLIVLLLAVANAGARYSVDAWLGRGAATVAEWPLTLLKIQLSLVYFFGAVSKINSVYLSGVVLYLNLRPGGLVSLPVSLRTLQTCAVLAAASVIVDMGLAFGLWLWRFRALTVVVGVLFHLTLILLLTSDLAAQLAIFAVACVSIYPLFFTTQRVAVA
jgi:Vitamin K-dependent gamma-carboxylase